MIECHLSLTSLTPKPLSQIKRPMLLESEEAMSSARTCSNEITKEPVLEFLTIFQSPFCLRGDH